MSCFITVIKHGKYVSQFVNIKYLNISAQCRVSSKSNLNDVCDRLSRWYGRQEKLWKTVEIKTENNKSIYNSASDFIRKWFRIQTQFSTRAQHPKLWWYSGLVLVFILLVSNCCEQLHAASVPLWSRICCSPPYKARINIQDSILIPHPPSQALLSPAQPWAYLRGKV